jgi:4-amino-4-deoxy-L-arabinose transferase-like glycosyltransferase
VYKLAEELSGERAGLLAGLVLTVSSGFIIATKWATEDPLLMLLIVTCLYTIVQASTNPSHKNILLVGISAGLAASAKISAGFLVFPVGLLLYRQYRQLGWKMRELVRNTGTVAGVGLSGYLFTTPTAVISPKLWYGDVISHYLFGSLTVDETLVLQLPYSGGLLNLGYLSHAVGLPLFLVMVAATGWAGYRIVTRQGRFVYPMVFLVPYVLYMSRGWNAQFFRMVVILPILAVFVGTFVDMLLSRPDSEKYVKAAFVLIILFSVVYTVVPVADFNTSRAEATEWTQANLPSDATVDVHARPLYRPQFAAGTKVTWIEVKAGQPDKQQRAIRRIESGNADYVVLSSYHYNRFFRDPLTFPETTAMYRSLLNEDSEYRITSQFGPPIATTETPMTHIKGSLRPGYLPKDGNPTIVVLQNAAE